MWHFVAASVAGSSHEADLVPCQDAAQVISVNFHGADFLVVVCSDGAGSATHSQAGSSKAVAVGIDFVVAYIAENGLHSVNRGVVESWYQEVHDALKAEATGLQVELSDLHCTLLMGIVGPDSSVFAQLGDGAIVIEKGMRLETVFWPQSGEFSNTTYFITGADFPVHLEVLVKNESPDQLAVFTDGLERLVLNFVERRPHEPFFRQMFQSLLSSNDPLALKEGLVRFLNSPHVNERTDDDKTLVLATRTDAPAIADQESAPALVSGRHQPSEND
jgi:hypothetical protein